jgi:hypothetical protein
MRSEIVMILRFIYIYLSHITLYFVSIQLLYVPRVKIYKQAKFRVPRVSYYSLTDHKISCLLPEVVLVKFILHEGYGFWRFTVSHSLTCLMLYRSLIFSHAEWLFFKNMQYETTNRVSTEFSENRIILIHVRTFIYVNRPLVRETARLMASNYKLMKTKICRSVALTAIVMKSSVLCSITVCTQLEVNRRFMWTWSRPFLPASCSFLVWPTLRLCRGRFSSETEVDFRRTTICYMAESRILQSQNKLVKARTF